MKGGEEEEGKPYSYFSEFFDRLEDCDLVVWICDFGGDGSGEAC